MQVLESIDQYAKSIQNNKCVYDMQRIGIEIFKSYVINTKPNLKIEEFDMSMINKLLFYWFPKNKKYVSETQVYQIVSTIGDIYTHILNYTSSNKDFPSILELYGEEYKRAYRAKNMLLKMTLDPVISIEPLVIGFDRYKNKRKRQGLAERSTTFIQAFFNVTECKEGGLIILSKIDSDRTYKILLEYPVYKYLKNGDIIHAVIRKKLFYVYWEIEELKGYYLKEATKFLTYDMQNVIT